MIWRWRKFLLKSGSFFFRFRNILFPVVFIILFLSTRPALFLGNRALDKIAVIAGILIALTGQVFRFLVIGFAYIKRGGKDGRVYADNLVREGFYAHTRNPMYLGNFLIVTGLGIIYGSFWIYLLVIPFFIFVYLSIVVVEEAYLKERFASEFESYCKRVNRFLPNFSGLRQSLSKFHYDWKKALRKDYGTFFGVIFGCYATVLWKAHCLYGYRLGKNEFLVSAIILLFYGLVRYLKKFGKLKSSS